MTTEIPARVRVVLARWIDDRLTPAFACARRGLDASLESRIETLQEVRERWVGTRAPDPIHAEPP